MGVKFIWIYSFKANINGHMFLKGGYGEICMVLAAIEIKACFQLQLSMFTDRIIKHMSRLPYNIAKFWDFSSA